MKIAVVGTGYVGLVTGSCLADVGMDVTCVDVDAKKIANLERGVIPIHEPGLDELVRSNHKAGRLRFTTSLPMAMQDSAMYFIAVGTPPGEDGSADLRYVLAVAREIGQNLNDYALIVDKSTVPVGTAEKVHAVITEELAKRGETHAFDVASNPEFLKEGAAVDDFMRPDRIVVGIDSERALNALMSLYAPFNRNSQRVVSMGLREAEMTKYAANAMLASRISFMNEISGLCEALGADVEQVRQGIGSDSRIGYAFIYSGAGYGGSCFPKDVQALVRMAEDQNIEPHLLRAVEQRNDLQKHRLFEKLVGRFGRDMSDLTFALWGLAFKPGTDDMREAPSRVLIESLLAAGATIRAHDPVAMKAARREFPEQWFDNNRLTFLDDPYEALEDADAMVLVTEWKPFRHPDFDAIKSRLKQPVIVDGRNQYDPDTMAEAGFEYSGIGRGLVF